MEGKVKKNYFYLCDIFKLVILCLLLLEANGLAQIQNEKALVKNPSTKLTTTASTGYQFVNKSDDTSGSQNPLNVTMDKDKNNIANFVISTYTLTINATNGSVTKEPDKTTYNYGENVKLTAAPATGYHFINWSGDTSGSQNPLNITMNKDKNITANFAINTYTLTINATNGSVTKEPGKTTYNYGENVKLTATPATGYHFVNWSGDASGSQNPLNVTMDMDKNITANFAIDTYILTVNATNGSVIKEPDKTSYNYAENVKLTSAPATGYHFVNWSGDASGSQNPLNVTMDKDKNITANIAIDTYTLTINSTNGSVAKEPDKTSYNYGENVKLTAAPATGYHFVNWSGDTSGSQNPLNVTMDMDKNITANFAIDTYTLTVNATNGSVTKEPGKTTYNYGENVKLTATPATDYHFVNWSGDVSGTDNPQNITMDSDKNITANFEISTFTILAIANENGTITPSGNIMVNYGADRLFLITPDNGYHVLSIFVDSIKVDSTLSYTFRDVTSNHSIFASFTNNPTSVKEYSSIAPKDYNLFQNYPNPFNPTTNIRFALPQKSIVTLEIFNIVGKRINTILTNASLNAGIFEMTWNSEDRNGSLLPSGIYLLRIIANSEVEQNKTFTTIKKLILLK
jgi:uncharacterized repeat protein (TIGR02543 family)